MDDLIARIRAAIDEDEHVLAEIERQLADGGENMEGGWSLWGRFGQFADRFIQPKRWRAEVTARRKILDEHEYAIWPMGGELCTVCREWPCTTIRAVAEAYGIEP